jgi:hypothetical protein
MKDFTGFKSLNTYIVDEEGFKSNPGVFILVGLMSERSHDFCWKT